MLRQEKELSHNLYKVWIFHLLCTLKFKGKNVAETLPFIENISKKIKEMLLLAPILFQTCQQICLLYPRKFDTDRYMFVIQLDHLPSAIYHSIKLPFDAEVVEKILNVIDSRIL